MSIKKPNTTYFGYMDEMPRDKRQREWKKQQKELGFDSTELWNLDSTIAKFVYPRLKMFSKNAVHHPPGVTWKEFKSILDEITEAFRLIADDEEYGWSVENNEKIQKGLELFSKYFGSLWI